MGTRSLKLRDADTNLGGEGRLLKNYSLDKIIF
jgi:hypothetical protein